MVDLDLDSVKRMDDTKHKNNVVVVNIHINKENLKIVGYACTVHHAVSENSYRTLIMKAMSVKETQEILRT